MAALQPDAKATLETQYNVLYDIRATSSHMELLVNIINDRVRRQASGPAGHQSRLLGRAEMLRGGLGAAQTVTGPFTKSNCSITLGVRACLAAEVASCPWTWRLTRTAVTPTDSAEESYLPPFVASCLFLPGCTRKALWDGETGRTLRSCGNRYEISNNPD